MSEQTFYMAISIVVYLLIVLVIGVKFSKSNNTVSDFYLGGRKLGPIVTAMSAEASDMSSYLLMGVPGVAFLSGAAEASWTAIGLAIGTYINWLLVAKRLRNYSQITNSITIPDFFSDRFKDKKRILTIIAAIVIIIFFIPYTASGFAACGKLFGTLFDVEYHTAMIVSAVVIIFYTTVGGFLAASTTDFIQSIIMSIALIIVFVFGIVSAGGIDSVIENTKDLPGYLSLTESYVKESGLANEYGFIMIVSTLAWGLGYFGMPHILLRFMAIEDSEKLKTSRRIASVWVVISLAVAVLIGITGFGMVKNGALTTFDDPETVIIQISNLLGSNGIFFALVAGVIIAGIFASTMSTADSQLLAASSAVSENIIGSLFKIKNYRNMSMIIARATLVIIAVIAIFLAWDPESSIFGIVSFAWAGFGAAFGPVILFALFWKRANMWGAFSGMVCGGVAIFVWKYLVRPMGGIWDIYELLPAFIIACAAIVIISVLTEKPSKEIIEEFEKARKGNTISDFS